LTRTKGALAPAQFEEKEPVNVLDAIGNTPLIELQTIPKNRPRVRIFAKFEGANPGGSVKDRAAKYMIEAAEASGELTPDKTIIEPTSGNTGIALAMIGSLKGYRVELFMPACVSVERRRVLEAFGAKVVLTPSEEGTDGAIIAAHRALEESPERYFMPNQFENPHNVRAHEEGTGPEIFEQTNGEIDYFVAGLGTSGTIMGAGRYLKSVKPGVKVIAVEPVRGHKIQGLKNMDESIVPGIYDPSLFDDKIVVDDDPAFETARYLAFREGLFVGMSSGAAVYGALRVAERIQEGTIVTVLPDRGDRYLSTSLFASICGQCPP
jgi:cysteine synthase B